MRPRKAVGIIVFAISGGVVLFFITMPMWGGWLVQRSMRETYDAISKVTLPCEPNTSRTLERWSKNGYSISCQNNGVKDGPWQAWRDGHLAVSGHYSKGKRHGEWLVYSSDGKSLYRTIKYEDGKEIADVLH
jgi:hypothetical protein